MRNNLYNDIVIAEITITKLSLYYYLLPWDSDTIPCHIIDVFVAILTMACSVVAQSFNTKAQQYSYQVVDIMLLECDVLLLAKPYSVYVIEFIKKT